MITQAGARFHADVINFDVSIRPLRFQHEQQHISVERHRNLLPIFVWKEKKKFIRVMYR